MLTHRPLADADIPAICDFPQSAEELFFLFPKARWPLTPEQVRESLAIRRDPTVALLDGELVGYVNFSCFTEGTTACIGNLVAAPRARGLGVGRYLVQVMTERAFAHHRLSELLIPCFHQNLPGLLLYAALGFRPDRLVERASPAGERVALLYFRMGLEDWERARAA